MTLPHERYQSIKNARAFLYTLLDPKKTPRVPKAIRKQAYWVLKHFPSDLDMTLAKKDDPRSWVS